MPTNTPKSLLAAALLLAPALSPAQNLSFENTKAWRQTGPETIFFLGGETNMFFVDGFWELSGCGHPSLSIIGPNLFCPLGTTGFIAQGDIDGDGVNDQGSFWSIQSITPAASVEPFRSDLFRLVSAPPSGFTQILRGTDGDVSAIFDVQDYSVVVWYNVLGGLVDDFEVTQYQALRSYGPGKQELDRHYFDVPWGPYKFALPALVPNSSPLEPGELIFPVDHLVTPDAYSGRGMVPQGWRNINEEWGLKGSLEFDPRTFYDFKWGGLSGNNTLESDVLLYSMRGNQYINGDGIEATAYAQDTIARGTVTGLSCFNTIATDLNLDNVLEQGKIYELIFTSGRLAGTEDGIQYPVTSFGDSGDISVLRVVSRDEGYTWEQAQDTAESAGGRLAVLNTQDKIDFVNEQLLAAGLDTAEGEWPSMWIGLSDSEEEGEWQWVTGEPLTDENWSSGSPVGEVIFEDDFEDDEGWTQEVNDAFGNTEWVRVELIDGDGASNTVWTTNEEFYGPDSDVSLLSPPLDFVGFPGGELTFEAIRDADGAGDTAFVRFIQNTNGTIEQLGPTLVIDMTVFDAQFVTLAAQVPPEVIGENKVHIEFTFRSDATEDFFTGLTIDNIGVRVQEGEVIENSRDYAHIPEGQVIDDGLVVTGSVPEWVDEDGSENLNAFLLEIPLLNSNEIVLPSANDLTGGVVTGSVVAADEFTLETNRLLGSEDPVCLVAGQTYRLEITSGALAGEDRFPITLWDELTLSTEGAVDEDGQPEPPLPFGEDLIGTTFVLTPENAEAIFTVEYVGRHFLEASDALGDPSDFSLLVRGGEYRLEIFTGELAGTSDSVRNWGFPTNAYLETETDLLGRLQPGDTFSIDLIEPPGISISIGDKFAIGQTFEDWIQDKYDAGEVLAVSAAILEAEPLFGGYGILAIPELVVDAGLFGPLYAVAREDAIVFPPYPIETPINNRNQFVLGTLDNHYELGPFFFNPGDSLDATLNIARSSVSSQTSTDTGSYSLSFQVEFIDTYAGFAILGGLGDDSGFPFATPSSERAPDYDFDRDGASNLLEYALQSDVADAQDRPAFEYALDEVAGGCTATLTKRAFTGTSLEYFFEYSTDLRTWTTILEDDPIFEIVQDDETTLEVSNLADFPGQLAAPACFLRVRVRIR